VGKPRRWAVLRLVRRPHHVWSTLTTVGLIVGAAGAVAAVAATMPASAASLGACGGSIALAPGDTGSCSETVSDTSDSTSTPVNVSLVINTTSTSGGGTAGSGAGTEAVLDGLASGLQVSVKDTTTGHTFSLGTISCYTDSSESAAASYPDATYCASSSKSQTVASDVDNASFGDSFVISWSFPLAAGNLYQGGGAIVQIASSYTGSTSGSGTLGASTGPTGGVLGASTPTTGAALPELVGELLLSVGFLLVLTGMYFYAGRQRRQSAGGRPQPPLN